MPTRKKLIYLILVFIVLLWGLNVVMIKFLTQYMSPTLLAAIRMPLAGIVLLLFGFRKYGLYNPSKKQWGWLFGIGLISVCVHQLFLGYGVSVTSSTNASLILALNPLTTALLASIFVQEKFTRNLGLGILLGFAGVVLVVFSKSPEGTIQFSLLGDISMVLAMLTYVIGGLLIKKLLETSIPTLVVTAYSTLIGGILLNLGTLVSFGPSVYGQIHLSSTAALILLLSAWGATALGTLGWNHGIKQLGANRTAMFLNGMPFASMFGGFVFLNEKITWIHILALILTTLGIVIGSIPKKKVILLESCKL
ncbi:DMT family transporter [Desulfosporosinus sp.]|uniref:DMT family transporter n=1 Tax=Desulfosporosinus sp. TaxID=157907 RepID=UPI0025BCA85D|nr:DMT family transporter [Desulfosporosinus sp.]MBC2724185.1 DMT family transporter [Desulfosporosinus sp.]MBC2725722.1 DMT family transporter [Desulfosporosinus sp.]